MINTPQQILQDAREEFENIFPKGGFTGRSRDLCCGADNCDENCDEIKRMAILNWHTSTLQSFIEAEIARRYDSADGR